MTSRKEKIEKINVLSTQFEKLGRGQQTFPGKGWVVKILDFEGHGVASVRYSPFPASALFQREHCSDLSLLSLACAQTGCLLLSPEYEG